ncbi:MAG: RDD family protein [Chloroflexota bacterium]|nr:RDD family protein [Chloroflexota bacterium]
MDDAYLVSTPENIELEYATAGLGARFLAALIDSLVLAILLLIITTAGTAVAVASGEVSGTASIAVGALTVLALFATLFGYYILFEAIWKGQTPGKRTLGLRVMRDDGLPLNFQANVIRNLIRFFDLLPGTYAFGVTAMFFNKQWKRLGDMAAGTIVVRDETPQPPVQLRLPSPEQLQQFESYVHGRLSQREYELVREYVARSGTLSLGASDRVGQRLSRLAESRTGLPRGNAAPVNYLVTILALQSNRNALPKSGSQQP